ncbi:MAG TPA: alpha/beta hydrolase [Rubricoccaceae bacterium]|jgi:acetyl esterase/lipase
MTRRLFLALSALVLSGCGLFVGLGVDLFYREAELPGANVRRDVAYLPDGDPKHRLNLFLPLADSVRARPVPTVVFVHGGNWDSGDRDLEVGGEDVYNNIGRFFARHGIAAAVVSYRLMPAVTWREQVDDVAAATAYVAGHAAEWGGGPQSVVLAGHSAGSYLALSVAVDPEARRRGGVCGIIPASGAGLDMTDRETFRTTDFDFFSTRFAPDRAVIETMPVTPLPWQVEASPLLHVDGDLPPALVLLGRGESAALKRQSTILDSTLRAMGVQSELTIVPARSHALVVPTLSRDDRVAGPAMLAFVRGLDCR